MAKTIEQRAEEYGRNRCKASCDDFNECFACEESLKCREYYCKVETYIEIATEQRKRDIEKAEQFCIKWLEEIIEVWLPELHDEPFHTKAVNEVKEKLHKAMEEE